MTGAGRLPLVDGDTDDPALAAVFDRFRRAGHDVPTLYRTLGNAPAMLDAWVAMAWPLRHDSVTSRGLRELIIMRVAQLTRAAYEWVAHRPAALKFGVTEEQLAAVRDWQSSEHFGDVEREVLALTDAIIRDYDVPDEVWAPLAARYAPGELVELVLTVTYYSCVSGTLRALRLPVDDADPALADF
ncbi:MAG: carboxymuconolactone decarboxylase family protein [Actinobacteria bacterium]|nr:carboxymuconolactone decarboxylase family protein [Actinomycetota bacterium]